MVNKGTGSHPGSLFGWMRTGIGNFDRRIEGSASLRGLEGIFVGYTESNLDSAVLLSDGMVYKVFMNFGLIFELSIGVGMGGKFNNCDLCLL